MRHSSNGPENASAPLSSIPPATTKSLRNPSSIPPELYERAHQEAMSALRELEMKDIDSIPPGLYIDVMSERLTRELLAAQFLDVTREKIHEVLEATQEANLQKGPTFLLKYPKASVIAFMFQAAKII